MSNVSKELYKEFNKNTKLFIRDLVKVYPEQRFLKLIHAAYKLCKTLNRKLPQKYFNKYVGPYSSFVFAKDDAFLGSGNIFSEFIKVNKSFVGLDAFIKQEWPLLSDHNKEMVWRYIQVLCVLNNKCLALALQGQGQEQGQVQVQEEISDVLDDPESADDDDSVAI